MNATDMKRIKKDIMTMPVSWNGCILRNT
jgi:hypothetical protein